MRPRSEEARRERIEKLYEKSRRFFPGVAEITAEELARRIGEKDLVVVDVRASHEQAVSMITGAISRREFESDPEAFSGATVVAYCTIGHRSGLYVQKLADRGWHALNLRGAILAWTHAGGALVDPEGPTRRVHVWSRKTSFAADEYEPVW